MHLPTIGKLAKRQGRHGSSVCSTDHLQRYRKPQQFSLAENTLSAYHNVACKPARFNQHIMEFHDRTQRSAAGIAAHAAPSERRERTTEPVNKKSCRIDEDLVIRF